MNFWFLISILKKRNDLADLAWGLGFILVAWLSFYLYKYNSINALLLNVLVTIWGVRLALHISNRILKTSEDGRYAKWREEWGNYALVRSYFQVYMLQGFFLLIISIPIIMANSVSNQNLSVLNIIGIIIWAIGFLFESISDYQLKRFLEDQKNKGKLIQEGLWAYSRHPNYFGEVTLWWGIWLLSLTNSISILGALGALMITFLILKVSGVPMLEKKMENKPGFKEYSDKVSIFFPLPPKK